MSNVHKKGMDLFFSIGQVRDYSQLLWPCNSIPRVIWGNYHVSHIAQSNAMEDSTWCPNHLVDLWMIWPNNVKRGTLKPQNFNVIWEVVIVLHFTVMSWHYFESESVTQHGSRLIGLFPVIFLDLKIYLTIFVMADEKRAKLQLKLL